MKTNHRVSGVRLLIHFIMLLKESLPCRSRAPFVELMLRILVSGGGHVTDALLAWQCGKHWTSYYKWVKGKHRVSDVVFNLAEREESF
jgi:hypothetical protein